MVVRSFGRRWKNCRTCSIRVLDPKRDAASETRNLRELCRFFAPRITKALEDVKRPRGRVAESGVS